MKVKNIKNATQIIVERTVKVNGVEACRAERIYNSGSDGFDLEDIAAIFYTWEVIDCGGCTYAVDEIPDYVKLLPNRSGLTPQELFNKYWSPGLSDTLDKEFEKFKKDNNADYPLLSGKYNDYLKDRIERIIESISQKPDVAKQALNYWFWNTLQHGKKSEIQKDLNDTPPFIRKIVDDIANEKPIEVKVQPSNKKLKFKSIEKSSASDDNYASVVWGFTIYAVIDGKKERIFSRGRQTYSFDIEDVAQHIRWQEFKEGMAASAAFNILTQLDGILRNDGLTPMQVIEKQWINGRETALAEFEERNKGGETGKFAMWKKKNDYLGHMLAGTLESFYKRNPQIVRLAVIYWYWRYFKNENMALIKKESDETPAYLKKIIDSMFVKKAKKKTKVSNTVGA